MKRGKKSSKKKTKRSAIIVALIIVIIALIIYGLSTSKPKHVAVQNEPDKTNFENDTVFQEEPKQEEKSDIKIFNGTDRPIAFMIDNNKNAQPQASINSTYMVYEIIVEGGETRLMALFKGKDADQVGPIRSSRHYFLDYAMENDAILESNS